MDAILDFIRVRLGKSGFINILQAFIILLVVVPVHAFFLPELLPVATLALMVALMGLSATYEKTRKAVMPIVKVFAISCFCGAIFIWIFPKNFIGYMLSVALISFLVTAINHNKFVSIPLIVINIIEFIVVPMHITSVPVILVPVVMFSEVLFGVAIMLLVAKFIHLSSEETIIPVPQPPIKATVLNTKGLKAFLSSLDRGAYRAIIAASLGCIIYKVLELFTTLIGPMYIFNSVFAVAQTSPNEAEIVGRQRILGITIGAVIGTATYVLFYNSPLYFVIVIPVAIALIVGINRIVFGKHFNIVVTTTYMLMIDTSAGHPLKYDFSKLLGSLIGILIALLVGYLFHLIHLKFNFKKNS